MPGAGQLNTLINILKSKDSQNSDTGETETTYSSYHRKIPAKKEDVSGGSTRRGLQVEESVRSVLTVPFIDDVSPHWRVEIIKAGHDNNETLEIVSILDREDRREWMELHCSVVK